jgi:hypothetical protein
VVNQMLRNNSAPQNFVKRFQASRTGFIFRTATRRTNEHAGRWRAARSTSARNRNCRFRVTVLTQREAVGLLVSAHSSPRRGKYSNK